MYNWVIFQWIDCPHFFSFFKKSWNLYRIHSNPQLASKMLNKCHSLQLITPNNFILKSEGSPVTLIC